MDSEDCYNAEQRGVALPFLAKQFSMPPPRPEQPEFLPGPTQPAAAHVSASFRALLTARNPSIPASQGTEILRALTGAFWRNPAAFGASGGHRFLHQDGSVDLVPASLSAGSSASIVVAVHAKGELAAAGFYVHLPNVLAHRLPPSRRSTEQ